MFIIDELPDLLGDFLNQIIDFVIMPFWNLILTILNFLINSINGLVNTIYGIYEIGAIIVNLIGTLFNCMFPGLMTSILILAFMLTIYLRIYYFIKGVKVAGTGL